MPWAINFSWTFQRPHAKRNSYIKFTLFIEKGAASFVFKDIIFHLLEPYWNLLAFLPASTSPRLFQRMARWSFSGSISIFFSLLPPTPSAPASLLLFPPFSPSFFPSFFPSFPLFSLPPLFWRAYINIAIPYWISSNKFGRITDATNFVINFFILKSL